MHPRSFVISLACVSCWAAAATADDFIPVDQIVSAPSIGLSDPEFDFVGNRIAWQYREPGSPTFTLFYANVDPNNGDILDPTTGLSLTQGGAGVFIDNNLVDLHTTGNGPEWALGTAGGQIVYTKFNDSHQMSLARATWDGVQWTPQLFSFGVNRFVPKGSRDPNDPAPRVAYFGLINGPNGREQRCAARTIDIPNTERIAPLKCGGANFIPDDTVLVTTAKPGVDLPSQAYIFDFEASIFQQVTFDPGSKLQSPEPWLAPDFAGGMAFVANVNFGTFSSARVYNRPNTEDNFTWTLQVEVRSPVPEKPFVKSPRPFLFNGKSYIVFMVQANSIQSTNAEIWIADLNPDPTQRFYRKVSEGTTGTRFDPETFTTTAGPIIYYSHITTGGIIVLRRAQTGLLVTP